MMEQLQQNLPAWVFTLPSLTVAGLSLAVAFGLLSMTRGRRDLAVIAGTALVYAAVPLMQRM